MAATAIAAGSLGALVALWRERTFQALALAVLALVFYLLIVQGIGLVRIRAIGSSLDEDVLQTLTDRYDAVVDACAAPAAPSAAPSG